MHVCAVYVAKTQGQWKRAVSFETDTSRNRNKRETGLVACRGTRRSVGKSRLVTHVAGNAQERTHNQGYHHHKLTRATMLELKHCPTPQQDISPPMNISLPTKEYLQVIGVAGDLGEGAGLAAQVLAGAADPCVMLCHVVSRVRSQPACIQTPPPRPSSFRGNSCVPRLRLAAPCPIPLPPVDLQMYSAW